jgi:carboxymethylenebutenolidase
MDRRDFLETAVGATLGTAFAAAVQPVMADSVIVTDSSGLQADVIQIKSGEQTISAYRAQPEGKKNLPVILVVSEIFGVHQHIADIARRFAKLGYLTIAPDLFARQGDPSAYTAIPDLLKNIVAKVPDAQVMQDLDAWVSWAAEHGGDIKRLGVTGFCWGGRITWMYAAHNPKVQAAVAWYGKLVNEKNTLQPHTAIEIAPGLRVPVLGLYGGKDSSIPQDTVERMRAALATGSSGSEIVVYPDAGHAFHADYRPSYAAADARDGWLRCVGWMRKFGV